MKVIEIHRTIKLLSTLLLASTYCLPTSAQNPARSGTDHAYFFYVTTFEDRGWERLPETKSEVEAIATELRTNYGFQTEIIANPTKQQVLDKIRQVNQTDYGEEDQVVFFFSTHGNFQQETERGFLIPADGKAYDPYGSSWISYDDLGSYVTLSKCDHVLLALDACYSGSFGDRWKGSPSGKPWDGSADCATKAQMALRWDSRLYFSSGSKEQRTPAQSKFASRWLEALRRGSEEGVVRIKDLRYYLSAIEYPAPEGGTFSSKHEEGGDFVFVHKNACDNGQRMSEDQGHWEALQPDFSQGKLMEHLSKYPGCPHYQEALQRLTAGREEPQPPAKTPERNTTPADLTDFVFVQGGTFQMGSNDGDDDEKPVHSVTLNDFYLHRNEVTNGEFVSFLNSVKPSVSGEEVKLNGNLIYNFVTMDWEERIGYLREKFVTRAGFKDHPVAMVTWYGAVEYSNWRSERDGLQKVYTISGSNVTANWNANGYRLPTEAEWEYAARSRGQDEKWAGTSVESRLSAYGNFCDKNCGYDWKIENQNDGYEYTAPVGSFSPNAIGLYDMSGNVWEWCWDWFYAYPSASQTNPRGAELGSSRVYRGGAWYFNPAFLHCTLRSFDRPDFMLNSIGFRLARSVR